MPQAACDWTFTDIFFSQPLSLVSRASKLVWPSSRAIWIMPHVDDIPPRLGLS